MRGARFGDVHGVTAFASGSLKKRSHQMIHSNTLLKQAPIQIAHQRVQAKSCAGPKHSCVMSAQLSAWGEALKRLSKEGIARRPIIRKADGKPARGSRTLL